MTGSAAMLRRNTLAHAPANPVFLACRPGPVTGSSDSIEYGLTDASGAVLLHCLVEWRASLDTVSGFEAACLEARAVMTLLKAQVRRRDVVLDDITDNPFAYPLEFLGLANSVSHIAFLTRQAAPALRRARLQPGDFDACANPPSAALDACLRLRRLWSQIETARRGGVAPVRLFQRPDAQSGRPPPSRLESLLDAIVLTAAMAAAVFTVLNLPRLVTPAWRILRRLLAG